MNLSSFHPLFFFMPDVFMFLIPSSKGRAQLFPEERSQLLPVLLLHFLILTVTLLVYKDVVPICSLFLLFLPSSFLLLQQLYVQGYNFFLPLVASLVVFFSYNGALQLIYQACQQSLMMGNYLKIIRCQHNQID